MVQRWRCCTWRNVALSLRIPAALFLLFAWTLLAMWIGTAMMGISFRGIQGEDSKICFVDDRRPLVVRIGIGTTVSRVNKTLMKTLTSIFSQRWSELDPDCVDTVHVHVFLEEEEYPIEKVLKRGMVVAEEARRSVHIPAAVHESNLHFERVPREWYSAAKLLGLLRLVGTRENVTTGKGDDYVREPVLIIADDDMVYDALWLDTLLIHHLNNPHHAVGLRGWRLRTGLTYGIKVPKHDGVWYSLSILDTYVVTGEKIYRPYRVGVVTGGCGLALKPSFFTQDIFSPRSDAPNRTMLVDDIWINGNLAMNNISRYVVPIRKNPRHLGDHASVIDQYLSPVGDKPVWWVRYDLNNRVTKYFAPYWEKDLVYDTSEGPPWTWRRLYSLRVVLSNFLLRIYEVCCLKK